MTPEDIRLGGSMLSLLSSPPSIHHQVPGLEVSLCFRMPSVVQNGAPLICREGKVPVTPAPQLCGKLGSESQRAWGSTMLLVLSPQHCK